MDPDASRAKVIERANMVIAMFGRVPHPTGGQIDLVLEEAVGLAEDVHDLDEWLRSGGFPPKVWDARARVREDEIREALHATRLILAWVLQNTTNNGELHIPYRDLEALDCQSVQRIDDHHKHEIVFSLIDQPKPALSIVKEP